MGKRTLLIVFLIAVSQALFCPRNSYALDKRLKLTFKTAGYGAATGALLGGGFAALGIGNFKNVLMGASAGMYAGIALAGYIIFTQEDYEASNGPRDPYSPRRPVDPEDDEYQERINEEMVPEMSEGGVGTTDGARLSQLDQAQLKQYVTVWTPVIQWRF